MTDWFDIHMTPDELQRMSALGLAHIGDAVYELLVRSYLCTHGRATGRNLHRDTVALVCAPAQARAVKALERRLTQEELAVFRRGRNAKPKSVPKSSSVAEYAHATAVEALFGWLYLQQRYDRLNELFGVLLPAAQAWSGQK